jgi:hypothetical protein
MNTGTAATVTNNPMYRGQGKHKENPLGC